MHDNADKGPQRFTESAAFGLPASSTIISNDRNVSQWRRWGCEWKGVKCAQDLCNVHYLCCYLDFLLRSAWMVHFILFTKLS